VLKTLTSHARARALPAHMRARMHGKDDAAAANQCTYSHDQQKKIVSKFLQKIILQQGTMLCVAKICNVSCQTIMFCFALQYSSYSMLIRFVLSRLIFQLQHRPLRPGSRQQPLPLLLLRRSHFGSPSLVQLPVSHRQSHGGEDGEEE